MSRISETMYKYDCDARTALMIIRYKRLDNRLIDVWANPKIKKRIIDELHKISRYLRIKHISLS